MPEEFEGDLAGAVFWGADLRGARFRDVNLREATITHAWLVDVEIDALIERVVINGVDVTAFVNEHDRWYPLRAVLGAADPESMRAGWAVLGEAWEASVARARRLPDEDQNTSVNGEWSFVQTLRHLLFVMDKWFMAPLLGRRFHPLGLSNTGSSDFPWPDLDREATPSLSDVLAARADQATRLSAHLAAVTADDLTRTVDVLENGPHPVRDCISTVLEEEFWHLRYADRDLAELEDKR
ncbi:MAG: DinB family protein [Ilumatobacteraceae bacterium]